MDIWNPEHIEHEHDFDVHKLIAENQKLKKQKADALSRLKGGKMMLEKLDGQQEYITVISALCEYETLIKILEGDIH